MNNNKLKLLIVDDEYLERNLLKLCVDWEKLNIEIIGEASNANEAFEIVDKYLPDIIFTDIKMPFINGLQFSEMVHKKYPDIKIIVISGLDSFEYVKKSIKIGIVDYILKPIIDDEVISTVMNLKEQIEQERNKQSYENELRKEFFYNLPLMRQKFLNDIIDGRIKFGDIDNKLFYLGVNFGKLNSFQIVAIENDNLDAMKLQADSKLNVMEQLLEKTIELFASNKDIIVFLDNNHRMVIISCDEMSNMAELCLSLSQTLNELTGVSLSIGIGTKKSDVREISLSYKEACEAINFKLIKGNNSVIAFSDVVFWNSCRENSDILDDLYDQFVFNMKYGLYTQSVETINKIYKNIEATDFSINSFRTSTFAILSICLDIIDKSNIEFEDFDKTHMNLFNEIFTLNTIPDFKRLLEDVISRIIQAIQNSNVKRVNETIIKITNHLDENINNQELSLSSVAKTFYLNSSYLSRIFKKEIGENFVDYLKKLRMEKASKLLMETDMKAFEIAEVVGIADANYFCTCFKKYTGLSVSEYKKVATKTSFK
ncbi:MAG TPA: response regulator [Ruminiclostridium sp.]